MKRKNVLPPSSIKKTGVIGIVASLDWNLLQTNFGFTKSGDKYAASARSVKGFDVYNARKPALNI
jgi:hypothetical protein